MFGLPNGGECGVFGNNLPVSVCDGCELSGHASEGSYNGENVGFCMWCSLG